MRVAPRDGHPRVAATSSGNAGRTTEGGVIYYKDDEDDDAGRSSKYNLMDKTKERKADKEVSWGRVLFCSLGGVLISPQPRRSRATAPYSIAIAPYLLPPSTKIPNSPCPPPTITVEADGERDKGPPEAQQERKEGLEGGFEEPGEGRKPFDEAWRRYE